MESRVINKESACDVPMLQKHAGLIASEIEIPCSDIQIYLPVFEERRTGGGIRGCGRGGRRVLGRCWREARQHQSGQYQKRNELPARESCRGFSGCHGRIL